MDDLVERARAFSRLYTRAIGVLGEGYLGSDFSLAEARVIYEIAKRKGAVAAQLGALLGMDAGYLSRILKRLEGMGLVRRERAEGDRRQSHLTLTAAGLEAFAGLDSGARTAMAALLDRLSPEERTRLAGAMSQIEGLLDPAADPEPVRLREPQPGDLGWVIARHAVLYGEEQGWQGMEGLTARIIGDLSKAPDPLRERCWIAERGGERLGCVFLVKDDEETARLRLLLVEPAARGLGLGRRLTEACVAFARQAGYRQIVLWTHAQLIAARRIYAEAGFEKIAEWTHADFGQPVVSETWRLQL